MRIFVRTLSAHVANTPRRSTCYSVDDGAFTYMSETTTTAKRPNNTTMHKRHNLSWCTAVHARSCCNNT